MAYNWQQKDWTKFRYSLEGLEDILFAITDQIGHVAGIMKALSADSQMEAVLGAMVAEAMKTSEIEGENLYREDVISSVRNNLGLNVKPEKIKDKKAEGIGQLMVAVRNTYADALTEDTLFAWHKMLMEGHRKITVGAWRKHKDPMLVISGAVGRERVHFEAPPSKDVPKEMKKFLRWFNDTAPGGAAEIKKAPLRAAIAHLYFESIHPFQDGNGRIGRAVAEKALSQTIGRPVLLSLSQAIEADRKAYYQALEQAQQSNEITGWIRYFVHTILAAQIAAGGLVEFTLKKAKFFDRFKSKLNERQLKAINRMLEEGTEGFSGGMTTKKYISITKTSKATATRDLQVLAELGALLPEGKGRSVRYSLML